MDERVVRWVAKTERMPEAGDADAQGCVLIWDENNGVMVAGIHNRYGIERGPVTHWATPPEGPGGGARPWDGREGTRSTGTDA